MAIGMLLGSATAWADGPTERMSVGPGGVQADAQSHFPALSRDGRFVVFQSDATNLASHADNRVTDVFVRDRQTNVTTLLSIGQNGGDANGASTNPVISGGGRFVAFVSAARNLVARDRDGVPDVFVFDWQVHKAELISVTPAGIAGGGGYPSISADGRFVAFTGFDNLVSGDTNRTEDVLVRDRKTGVTKRVSVSSSGGQGNGFSNEPAISGNGRFVAFQSAATNLVPGDTTGGEDVDVFVHDRQTGATARVSVGFGGAEAHGDSTTPAISGSGRFVAFASNATNLVAGGSAAGVFVFDRQTNVMEPVGTGETPDISADGRYVTYRVQNPPSGSEIFVHDRQTHTDRLVSVGKMVARVAALPPRLLFQRTGMPSLSPRPATIWWRAIPTSRPMYFSGH